MYIELTQDTMIGELVKYTVDELKAARKPWQELSESEQDSVLSRLRMHAEDMVGQIFGIVLAQDYIHEVVVYEQMTIKDGVKIQVNALEMSEALLDISRMKGKKMILLAADPEIYFGVENMPHSTPDQASLIDKDDPLYSEAIKWVHENKKSSISALQRGLRIGYNRAARLLEQMESDGYLSEINSDGTRVILNQQST